MKNDRMPVVIAGIDCLSGVTTWADRLRAALADHPRYDVRLLYIGRKEPEGFDLHARSIQAANQAVCRLAPVIFFPNYLWDLFLSGFEPGVHCVGMCHADSDEEYYSPLSWYEPLISKFIGVSRECSERLKERIPRRAQDVMTLPYGICLPRQLRRSYQTEPLRLIYAGRVTQLQKRVWDFVPLVERLLSAKVNFVFDIVGTGDEYAPLEKAMRGRFPEGCVRFVPRIPHHEMGRLWSSHDVFVQVSDFEGTSVSMLEAMAHGIVPAVTGASSGITGVVHHEQNGFVVPVGDMQALAEHIGRLAADQSLLAKMGDAARQSAQAYSMESYSERFVTFLDEVAEAGHEIDLNQQYGVSRVVHPLFRQRQLILDHQEEITRLTQPRMKKILVGGYRTIVSAKLRRSIHKRRLELARLLS